MNVKDLKTALESLYAILAATNSRGQKDVAAFLEIFEGHEEETVEAFLLELEDRLHAKDDQLKVGRSYSPVGQVDALLVARHVRQLRDAGNDRSRFDAAFSLLHADDAIGKAEAEAIAYGYIGFSDGRKSWPHKKAALRAIEDWYKHIAFDDLKMQQLERARYTG